MLYFSTRSKKHTATASEAILAGLAPDGGLFVPESLPQIDFEGWRHDTFQEIATKLFSYFLTDFSEAAIQDIVHKSYSENFDHPQISPIHWLDDDCAVLELWHGPTLAFKDLALQCLPHLFEEAKKIQNIKERFLILTATSGDTGKAAMSGFTGKKDILLAVFYPHKGVSSFQERQMLTSAKSNVRAFALEGNFDDCQRSIKAIMQDQAFVEKMKKHSLCLTSANSINIGRLIPQMVYYIFAYLQASDNYGDSLSVVVPSGNMGNILAARYCKEMGLPLGKIHLAANSNNVLHDFISGGRYNANRKLLKTTSPSMDILVASNMERYLFLLTKDNYLTKSLMEKLKTCGDFSIDPALLDLSSSWVTEDQVFAMIKKIYTDYNYLLDPHSAVAAHACFNGDISGRRLIVSTASPYKFAESVLTALDLQPAADDKNQILQIQNLVASCLPQAIEELWENEPREKHLLQACQIEKAIDELIGCNYETD